MFRNEKKSIKFWTTFTGSLKASYIDSSLCEVILRMAENNPATPLDFMMYKMYHLEITYRMEYSRILYSASKIVHTSTLARHKDFT